MLFSSDEINSKFAINKETLKPDCEKCGLHKSCLSPMMGWTGKGRKEVLIIAEAPGAQEDLHNTQLIGQAGQFLRDKLDRFKLDLDKDFWKINAVNCRPITSNNSNRTPTKKEIKCCRPFVTKAISILKPKHIWLLGNVAIESFMNGRFRALGVSRFRGLHIPDKDTGAWVYAMHHPSYILRNEHNTNVTSLFDKDLRKAVNLINTERYTHTDYNNKVKVLYDYIDVMNQLNLVLKNKPKELYIDYETTGIKPYVDGHKIVTISFCYGCNMSYAFPFQWKSKWTKKEFLKIKLLWRNILRDPAIQKIAHNLKFEHIWGKEIVGVDTTPWGWDTMLAAHILDNRRSYTGLKFQTYAQFGVPPYDGEVTKYLKSDKHGFNNIENTPLDKLLLYNGLDTLFGMMLYKKQNKRFQFKKQLEFFQEGILNFADMEMNGIAVSEDYYEEQGKLLEKEIDELKKELLEGNEAELFVQKTGKKLDIASNKDLGVLFYDILDIDPVFTDKKNYKVDKETIAGFEIPFAEKLLELRKKDKLKGTFLAQFVRETSNNRIHPHFSLHIAISYRSSSDSPNFHNIPKRDIYAKKITRGGLVPSEGNQLLEIDFSGIEVCIAACVTQDPELIKYVSDSTTDMHLDTAVDLWMLDRDDVTKDIRFCSKGGWVFAQFYGSYYANCALELWKERHLLSKSGIKLEDNLERNGINCYEQFEEHCQKYEQEFWGKRFKVYNTWKNNINEKYHRDGYVTSPFGFRFSGQMSKNELTNYPIQSGAFHVLLWCLNKISAELKEGEYKTKIIGQIHDSIIFDVCPQELDNILVLCNTVCTKETRKEFDWITVPLEIDAEISKINGNFAEMEDIKF